MVSLRAAAWRVVVVLVLVTAGFTASAAEVTARLDRQRVVVGETVTLELRTGDPQQSLDTSLTDLESDFQVIDQRSETQMSIVNGRQTATIRVLVTLEPRRAGALRIPPLRFAGGAVTQPISLQVDSAPELAPGEAPPVFIETSLDPVEGPYYVHAQLSLKVRIFYLPTLTEAAINPPSPAQASVRLLDEVPYQAERSGQRYRVLERRYAIFPERSGELTIPPMQLTGRLTEHQPDRLWQPSVRGRRVTFESDPLTLTVKPRAAGFQGTHWLPARRIDLSQQISDTTDLRVGEPVTRTVILDAVGLEEHMLEEPQWPAIVSARIYPDQPQGISRDDGEWVLGHREFRYAVVPEQPGELLLPEIRLHWWDTVGDRERVAILPEHRVRVLPSDLPGPAPPAALDNTGRDVVADPSFTGTVQRWRLLAAAFAILWLLTLALYLRGGRAQRPDPAAASEASNSEKAVLRALEDACRKGDAAAARNQFNRWMRRFGPPAGHRVPGVASGDGFAAAIRALDGQGFRAGAAEDWDGTSFWKAFESWRAGLNPIAREDAGNHFDLYRAARRLRGA